MGRRERTGALATGLMLATTMVIATDGTAPVAAAPLCTAPAPVTAIADSGAFVGATAVDGDGSRIAFESDADLVAQNADRNGEIYLYDSAGPTITQITQTSGNGQNDTGALSISADGTKVVFVSSFDLAGGSVDDLEAYLYDVPGDSITRLTDNPVSPNAELAWVTQAALSADGSTVAFVSDSNFGGGNADGNREIFTVDTSSLAVTQVTSTTGDSSSNEPSPSANGAKIAFSSSGDLDTGGGNGTEIFLYDEAGPTTTQLTTTTTGFNDHPALSADGTRVAFRSTSPLVGSGGNAEIYLRSTGGSALTQVTNTGAGESRDPVISADGSRVAFGTNANVGGTNADRNSEVYLFDRGTGATTALTASTDDQRYAVGPGLSGDGTRVLFRSNLSVAGANIDGSDELQGVTCAPSPRPDALIATASAGPYTGDGVYSATVTSGQTRSATVARGATRKFHVRIQNDRAVADTLKVKGVTSGSAGYTVRYFAGTTDITAAVVAGSYSTGALAPGASVTIKVKIKASSTTTAGSARNVDVTARSTTATSIKDTVRARATRS